MKIKQLAIQNKKLTILLAAIFILGFLFFFVRLFFFNRKVDEALEILYDPNKLIVYKDNDSYGYLNSKGEKVIESKFQEASEFFNGYAVVKDKDKEDEYQFINTKGEVKSSLTSDAILKYLPIYRVWYSSNKIYNDELKVLFEGNYHINYINYGFFEFMDNEKNSSGIVDATGKVIFKWDQDYIQVKIPENNYSKNGYYALISNYEEEEKIISLQTGKELFSLEDAKDTYIRDEKNNIFRIIDRADSFKTKTWFYINDDKISYKSNEPIYSISLLKHDDDVLEIDYGPTYKNQDLEKQYVYYNVNTGKTLDDNITKIDEALLDSTYGYHTITCDKLYGINKGDKENASCTYDEVKYLDESLYNYLKSKNKEHIVLLKKDSDIFIYNMRKKKTIETFENASIYPNQSSTFVTITQFEEDGFTKKSVLIYNLLTHKSQEFDKDSEIKIYSNYIVINGKYYNTNLDLIYE